MEPLRTFFLLISLAAASSQGYSIKQSNDLTLDEKFSNDMYTVVHDLIESDILKQKAVVEAASAIGMAEFNILKNVKTTDYEIANTLINVKLVLTEAFRAASIEFIKTFVDKGMFLLDRVPPEFLADLMESPLFDFAMDTVIPLLSKENTIGQVKEA